MSQLYLQTLHSVTEFEIRMGDGEMDKLLSDEEVLQRFLSWIREFGCRLTDHRFSCLVQPVVTASRRFEIAIWQIGLLSEQHKVRAWHPIDRCGGQGYCRVPITITRLIRKPHLLLSYQYRATIVTGRCVTFANYASHNGSCEGHVLCVYQHLQSNQAWDRVWLQMISHWTLKTTSLLSLQ